MRKDQIARLKQLAADVAEVFIEEADPQNWNGAGQELSQMDTETRGNRYWDKKNAIQTGTLLARVLDLADYDSRVSPGLKIPDYDADKHIAKYEKAARELIGEISGRATH